MNTMKTSIRVRDLITTATLTAPASSFRHNAKNPPPLPITVARNR